MQETEVFRQQLIILLEKGLEVLMAKNISDDDVILGKQALQFLKQSRIGRIDTSRHLNVLLNSEAFSAIEIGENAKLLLKFVK